MHTQLSEKFVVFVFDEIIVADAAADENLFNLVDGAYLAQKLQIVGMVDLGVFANVGIKALALLAGSVFCLLFTCGKAEVGGGTADVVNVALEVGNPCELLDLV